MLMFTDIVALRANDSYCLSRWRGENKGTGAEPPENCWNHAFSILEKRPF